MAVLLVLGSTFSGSGPGQPRIVADDGLEAVPYGSATTSLVVSEASLLTLQPPPAEMPPLPVPAAPARPQELAADLTEDAAEEQPATWLGEPWHRLGPVTGEYLYAGEVFSNAHGGIATQGATRYRGLLELSLRLDTGAANWWQGGEVYAYLLQAHGTTLTPRFVGDSQLYSNLDTGPKPQDLTELGEFWYQHKFLDETLLVRVGRQDANEDFAYADLAAEFLNSSFATLPNIPMPFWPFQTLGVTALYEVSDKLRLGGGMYDHGRDKFQWWAATEERGLFLLGQADCRLGGGGSSPPPTLVRTGLWYASSDTWAVDGSGVFEGNYGVYGTVDQICYRESGSEVQGLGVFVQLSWAPPDRNQVEWNYGAGLVYRGLLKNRDDDVLGAGFTLLAFSPVEREWSGRENENAIELFYQLRTSDWSVLQPDLQYIVSPNGLERDALAVGVRWEMNL